MTWTQSLMHAAGTIIGWEIGRYITRRIQNMKVEHTLIFVRLFLGRHYVTWVRRSA